MLSDRHADLYREVRRKPGSGSGGFVSVAYARCVWLTLSRVRLSGRTVMSVLKESLDHGKTPIYSC